ncbi:hypothetical protein Celaphus_00009706, partial [Cervus elaphus hippelaphus]
MKGCSAALCGHVNPGEGLILRGEDGGVQREVVQHSSVESVVQFETEGNDTLDVIITDSSDPLGPAENLFKKSCYQLMKNSYYRLIPERGWHPLLPQTHRLAWHQRQTKQRDRGLQCQPERHPKASKENKKLIVDMVQALRIFCTPSAFGILHVTSDRVH